MVTNAKNPGRKKMPLSLLVFLVSMLIATVISIIQASYPFLTSLGNMAMVMGVIVLAIAWVLYLKKDGVRFFSRKRQTGNKPAESWPPAESWAPPESWADRAAEPGAAPQPPYPIPHKDANVDDSEYQRLAQAELALRRKMAGEDSGAQESEPDGEVSGGDARRDRIGKADAGKGGKTAASMVIAGVLLFAVGLIIQYL